jgi:hypothetical protein
MTDGYGYFDDGAYVIAGFRIRLQGASAFAELLPERIRQPSKQVNSHDDVDCSVNMASDTCEGRINLVLPIWTISQLEADILAVIDGNRSALRFPVFPPDLFVYWTPKVQISLSSSSRSRSQLRMRCELRDPPNELRDAQDPLEDGIVDPHSDLVISTTIDMDCLRMARQQLCDFLRFIYVIPRTQQE